MAPSMRYALLTIKHKWFVLVAGLRIGCPLWRLITHDLSKLSRHELRHYGARFCSGQCGAAPGFEAAWIHHQNTNDHHWEYWVSRDRDGDFPVEMPRAAVLEMVADWLGASRAYEGRWPSPGDYPWFKVNWPKIVVRLHPVTACEVLVLLGYAATGGGEG